jgi:hypothetical protein
MLKSRQFTPRPGIELDLAHVLETNDDRRHVLVQLEDVPTDAQRAALEAAGIRLLDYVPNHTWFASIATTSAFGEFPSERLFPGLVPSPGDRVETLWDLQRLGNPDLSLIRWMGAIRAADRLAPSLRERVVQLGMLGDHGQIDLDIRFFSDVSPDDVFLLLSRHEAVVESDLTAVRFVVRIAADKVEALAEEDGVQWIANALPPKIAYNDGSRVRTNVDVLHSVPYDLGGSDVDLGMWDGGVVDGHIDFSGRLTVVADGGVSVNSHATHVAGTMAGNGSNSISQGGDPFQWRGMATEADIISYSWDNNLSDHNGAINVYGIELSQNSWGYTIGSIDGNCSLYGDYDFGAPDYDDIITGRYGKRIVVVFAAGNERNDGDCGMSGVPPYLNYGNIGPPSTAKNVIVVGDDQF